MTDPLPEAVSAVLHNDVTRLPIVVFAGLATSLGPCVAPRYVALAALLGGAHRIRTVAAYAAGVVTVYAALGLGTGLLSLVTRNAGTIDAVLAVALIASGIATLVHEPACRHERSAEESPSPRLSGSYTLGAASGLVVSPCCTPMVAAVAAFPVLDGSPLTRAAMLAAFALGHTAPMLATGMMSSAVATRIHRWTAAPATAVVGGTLTIALGAYYGILV